MMMMMMMMIIMTIVLISSKVESVAGYDDGHNCKGDLASLINGTYNLQKSFCCPRPGQLMMASYFH